jgi:hypothetical protein
MRWRPKPDREVVMEGEFGEWRKSTRSEGGSNCVEVANAADASAVQVRDSKDPAGPVLVFSAAAWRGFIATR